jgi:hypothetical protein
MNNDKILDEKNEPIKKADKIDIKKYEDPTGLGVKNLNLGWWLATNRRRIIKTIVITLSIISGFLVLYAVAGYIFYFSLGKEQELALEQSNFGVDLANYRAQSAAKPLEILAVKTVVNKTGYDFIAKVKNPNSKHYAIFNYCFIFNSGDRCSTSFVLPNEEKNIILFNQVIPETINNISFKTDEIKWQKLNAKNIPDWAVYEDQRLSFAISDIKTSTYDGDLNYLEFSVSNDSAYAYYSVPLNIIVENNGEIIAVNRYTLSDINSRDKKEIRFYWPDISSMGGTIKIVPELNIIDNSIYKPYRAN